MSIQEQAQQLASLAEQVPTGMTLEVQGQLEGMQQQVVGILGDTTSATELQGQISAVLNEVGQLAAGLEHVRQTIADTAMYHQQG